MSGSRIVGGGRCGSDCSDGCRCVEGGYSLSEAISHGKRGLELAREYGPKAVQLYHEYGPKVAHEYEKIAPYLKKRGGRKGAGVKEMLKKAERGLELAREYGPKAVQLYNEYGPKVAHEYEKIAPYLKKRGGRRVEGGISLPGLSSILNTAKSAAELGKQAAEVYQVVAPMMTTGSRKGSVGYKSPLTSKGGSFASDFKRGFNSVMSPAANILSAPLMMAGPEGMAAAAALQALSRVSSGGWKPTTHDRFSELFGTGNGGYSLSEAISHGKKGLELAREYGPKAVQLYKEYGPKVAHEYEKIAPYLKKRGGKRAPTPHSMAVKRVMAEHGMPLGAASKYVKMHGLA